MTLNLAVSTFLIALAVHLPLSGSWLSSWIGDKQIAVGPQVYHAKRTRENGSWQKGWIQGVIAQFRVHSPKSLYFNVEGRYAEGDMLGRNGSSTRISKSRLIDWEWEVSAGYNFSMRCSWEPMITPYIGFGELESKNHFEMPTSMTVHFRNKLDLYHAGLIIEFFPCEWLGIELDAKMKWMLEGMNVVTNDPMNPDRTRFMKERTQHEVSLPIRYRASECSRVEAAFVPFYRFRHFGGHESFITTKYRLYGASLLFSWCF